MNAAFNGFRYPWEEERPVFWGILIAFTVSFLGGMATPLTDWYYSLDFPGWKPPDWAFGPAWTTIFILTTYAGIKSWRAAAPSRKRLVVGAYLANGSLNILWSIFFFTLQRPDLALMEIPFLIVSIILLIGLAQPAGKWAMRAVLPYLIWVSYAGMLNWAVVARNAPFT